MKRRNSWMIVIFLPLFILLGCTPSYESFNLTRMEQDFSDNTQPYLFIVAPKKERSKVKLYYHGMAEALDGFEEVKQKLKKVIITESEMVIETTEERFVFKKLSESLAVDENNILYEVDYEKNYPRR